MVESTPAVDPADRYVRASQFAASIGITSRHLMAMKRKYPDLWPKTYLRANTTFFVRHRDLDAFVKACAEREAAIPEPFAENGRKAHKPQQRGEPRDVVAPKPSTASRHRSQRNAVARRPD